MYKLYIGRPKRIYNTLLSSSDHKIYNNLKNYNTFNKGINKNIFNNIILNNRLEPSDNSCTDMKTIAIDINKLNSSREINNENDEDNEDIEYSRTPSMECCPTIINGYLIEKYMSNKVNIYFDKIYILNIDKHIDRWLNIKKIFDHFKIFNYKRFPGIDGSLLKDEWKNNHNNTDKSCDIKNPGSWGILSGMKNLLMDAKKNKYTRILILQDNIILHNNFNKEFNKNINKIPNNWNLLYLGTTSQHETFSHNEAYYHPNGKTYGSFAVGIHSRMYDYLIKLIDARFGSFDVGCLGNIQKNFNRTCYVMQPYLIFIDLKENINHNRHSKKNKLKRSPKFIKENAIQYQD
jgi:hypothetical protein